jgi:hypothetical protein
MRSRLHSRINSEERARRSKIARVFTCLPLHVLLALQAEGGYSTLAVGAGNGLSFFVRRVFPPLALIATAR